MPEQNGWKKSGWLGGEWMRKNNNSQLKKRKIKSVHFPHFLWWFGAAWRGEERENRLYIGSFVCRRTSSFFTSREYEIFPSKCAYVCVCEWEKFIILKGGLVAKNMCICKAIFKRLLLFLGSVQCCWMSGAKGILQNDIYAFLFTHM